jgi:hypothetical protein
MNKQHYGSADDSNFLSIENVLIGNFKEKQAFLRHIKTL